MVTPHRFRMRQSVLIVVAAFVLGVPLTRGEERKALDPPADAMMLPGGAGHKAPRESEGRAQDHALPSMERIREVTAQRASRIKSIRLIWDGQSVVREGAYGNGEKLTLSLKGEIVLRGTSARFGQVRDTWHNDRRIVKKDQHHMRVVHKDIGKYMSFSNRRGRIDPGPVALHVTEETFRLFAESAPEFLHGKRYAVLRREATSDGDRIIVGNTDYEESPGRSIARVEYFLDPNRDYLPTRRLSMTAGGRANCDTRVEYRKNAEGIWIPTKLVDKYIRGVVSEWHIRECTLNEEVEDSVFEFEFPPGTIVHDGISEVEFKVPSDHAQPYSAMYREGKPFDPSTLAHLNLPAGSRVVDFKKNLLYTVPARSDSARGVGDLGD